MREHAHTGHGVVQAIHAVGVVCYKAFMQWVWFAIRLSCSGCGLL